MARVLYLLVLPSDFSLFPFFAPPSPINSLPLSPCSFHRNLCELIVVYCSADGRAAHALRCLEQKYLESKIVRTMIFVSVQPSSIALFGVSFPLPTPQGRRDSQLRTMPRARVSDAAQGNTQDTEATLANLLRRECQGCSEARRPSRPASRIQSSGAFVTSQPWIQLTGGYARCVRTSVL
jgi:hypothetical protein